LIAWVPFRSPDIQYAFSYWKSMFFKGPGFSELANVKQGFFYTTIFFFYYAVAAFKEIRPDRRNAGLYAEALCYFTAILLMPGPQVDFIYFQF
ncbi:MAG: hypothetical protein O2954_10365, partial [bacterium]|nr:hypothetical protein [bacterium]